MIKFTGEQKQFLNDYVPGHHYKEIMEAFNNEFPTNCITLQQVKSYIANHKLNTGFTGRFNRGHISFNKGKKWEDYMSAEAIEKTKKTLFVNGMKPTNYRPVGSSRTVRDGYVEIKIADPNVWRLRSRIVWEEAHGKIPKSHVILHKNGISSDDRLENLVLLSRQEIVRLNASGLFDDNVEINEVAINIAKIKTKVSNLRSGKNGTMTRSN